MQIKIFNIPLGTEDSQIEEMNHFLRANKIIDVKKELAIVAGNSCWTFCITYLQTSRLVDGDAARNGITPSKVDYKEVLDTESFERFSNLRKIRKQVADADAVPAYAVFTDAELAELAKLPKITLDAMLKIPGIGRKKIEKYGVHFFSSITTVENEAGG